MAKRAGAVTRAAVTDPPLWRRPPASTSKVDVARLFALANPIFTRDEFERTVGSDHVATLEQLVSKGEIKRQATGVFSAMHYDQNHPEVALLIGLTGAKPATPERMARQAAKVAERIAVQHEDELRRRPAADRIMSMRAKVFSTREAWDRLGEDPRPAIGQLTARGVVTAIHAGLYCKRGVEPFGPELLQWACATSERRSEIVRSIDASQEMHGKRDDSRGTPASARVTGMKILEKDEYSPRMRIRIYFSRMGWIQAVAGGPGNRHAAWQSKTEKTGLTKDAAAFIAEQIFGRDVSWGDLIDMARKHAANPDKNPQTSATLPGFRRRSYFDYERRPTDIAESVRCRTLRDDSDASDRWRPGSPCVLYVDHREDKRIVDALQGIAGLYVVPVTLETGDFVAQWGPAAEHMAVFERKTGPDFQATILDRDLDAQMLRMQKMAEKGARCFLIQQGDAYDVPPTPVDGAGNVIGRRVSSREKSERYVDMALRGVLVVPVDTWQLAAAAMLDAICSLVPRSMAAALPLPADDPKTDARETSAESCVNQDNIAAGFPTVPS